MYSFTEAVQVRLPDKLPLTEKLPVEARLQPVLLIDAILQSSVVRMVRRGASAAPVRSVCQDDREITSVGHIVQHALSDGA